MELSEKIKQVVIAIDFDGTICTVSYPEIGREREGAKEFINMLYDEGYLIVINTCRSDGGDHKAETIVRDFMKLRGIKYHAINENLDFLIEYYKCDTRKISADVYIDDKCLFTLPTWEQKYNLIKRKFPNPKDKYDQGYVSIPQGLVIRKKST
jgi:hypothetical protein